MAFKLYLNELTDEELKKVWKANEKLQNRIYEDIWESNMEMQLEDGNMILNDDCRKYYRMEDNYSSFYLILIDGYGLMNNLNMSDLLDYSLITEEMAKKYKKAKHLYEDYQYHDSWTDKVLDLIEDIGKEVLKNIEKWLHSYEEIDYSYGIEYFMNLIDNYSDIYIKSTDDYIAYSDSTKCYA